MQQEPRAGALGVHGSEQSELTRNTNTPQELPLSNRLTALAEDVKMEAESLVAAERSAAEHALNAGRLLCEAKEACRHGEWLLFLARAGVPERSAQRWMKLHRSDLKSDTVSDLGGVIPALHFLRMRHLAEQSLIKAVGAYQQNDLEEFISLLQATTSAADEMLGMFPAEQVAAARAAHKGAPEFRAAIRQCVIAWAASRANGEAS